MSLDWLVLASGSRCCRVQSSPPAVTTPAARSERVVSERQRRDDHRRHRVQVRRLRRHHRRLRSGDLQERRQGAAHPRAVEAASRARQSADALPILEAAGQPDPEQIAAVFDGDPTTSFYGTPGLLPPGDRRRRCRTSLPAATCSPASSLHRMARPTASLGMAADSRSAKATRPPRVAGHDRHHRQDDHRTAWGALGHYAVKNGGKHLVRLQRRRAHRRPRVRCRRRRQRLLQHDRHGRGEDLRSSRAARRRVQRDDAGRRDGVHRRRSEIGSLPHGRQHRREQQDSRERRVHCRLTVARRRAPATACSSATTTTAAIASHTKNGGRAR